MIDLLQLYHFHVVSLNWRISTDQSINTSGFVLSVCSPLLDHSEYHLECLSRLDQCIDQSDRMASLHRSMVLRYISLTLLTTHRQILFSLSVFVQVEIPVTSHPQTIGSWPIRSSLCGASKWSMILPRKPARVL